jgi:hypothetical protein
LDIGKTGNKGIAGLCLWKGDRDFWV